MPTLSALFTTAWGWILLVKIAMVAGLVAYGVKNHFGTVPELEYAQVQRSNDDVSSVEVEQLSILRRRLLPEMALVVGILIASGFLVQASPIPG
jgi:Putative copper export protein